MFIPRIYFPHPISLGNPLACDEKTSHYLCHVLRLKSGDPIIVFNGQGGEYSADIHFEKKKVTLTPTTYHDVNRSSSLNIHLGQAISRGDRMDFAIQKATELGVNDITPLFSEYTAVKLEEGRSQKRMTHWMNIAISAAEQSGRTDIPVIHPPLTVQEWIKMPFTGTSICFDIGPYASLKALPSSSHVRIAIGPESGWSTKEHTFMKESAFTICSMGPRILRTETAGMTAIALLQGFFGDLA